MTDRAYIFSRTLEDKIAIAENSNQNTLIVTLGVLKEILTMLKEQPEIVRCKDCKYYRYYGLSAEIVSECTIDNRENQDGDYFCADGKRREET